MEGQRPEACDQCRANWFLGVLKRFYGRRALLRMRPVTGAKLFRISADDGGSMSFTKLIVPAIAASFFAFAPAPASAVTLALPGAALGQAADSMIVDVQHRRGERHRSGPDRRYRKPPPRAHRGPPQRYRPGGRYNRPPPGWRRYGGRPGNWQRRGCVMVGPVWFCP